MTIRSDAPGSLRSIGNCCRDAFLTITNALTLHYQSDKITASFENQLERFNLWAINLGLYQDGHSSLDYRFRDAPTTFQFAKRLLQDIEDVLTLLAREISSDDAANDLTESATPVTSQGSHAENQTHLLDTELSNPADESSEDSEDGFLDSYNVVSTKTALLDSLSSTIDRLYRLSFQIRNPALRVGQSKAAKYQEIDPETGIDIFDCYAHVDAKHIVEVLRDLRAAEFKKHENTPSILRGKLLDRENAVENETYDEKQLRLSIEQDEYLVKRLARANTRRRQQFKYWKRHREKNEFGQTRSSIRGPSHVIPQYERAVSLPTTATYFNEEYVEWSEMGSVISSASYIIMEQETEKDQISLPPPPKSARKDKEFVCPFCGILCSKRTASSRYWRVHVFRDLRPYICLEKHCQEAGQLFDTTASWLTHMREYHHNELSSLSGAKHPKCPMCYKLDVSYAHIASHLQRIALFSLPQLSTGEGRSSEGTSMDSARAQAVRADSDRSTRASSISSTGITFSTNSDGFQNNNQSVEREKQDLGGNDFATYGDTGVPAVIRHSGIGGDSDTNAKEGTRHTRWLCCNCLSGLWSIVKDSRCPECNHQRDSGCTTYFKDSENQIRQSSSTISQRELNSLEESNSVETGNTTAKRYEILDPERDNQDITDENELDGDSKGANIKNQQGTTSARKVRFDAPGDLQSRGFDQGISDVESNALQSEDEDIGSGLFDNDDDETMQEQEETSAPGTPPQPNAREPQVALPNPERPPGEPPEGARWTKVRRTLINPEALTEAKERFEERQDYVIVLRPLRRDEIQKLANRTQEIRESRNVDDGSSVDEPEPDEEEVTVVEQLKGERGKAVRRWEQEQREDKGKEQAVEAYERQKKATMQAQEEGEDREEAMGQWINPRDAFEITPKFRDTKRRAKQLSAEQEDMERSERAFRQWQQEVLLPLQERKRQQKAAMQAQVEDEEPEEAVRQREREQQNKGETEQQPILQD